MASYSLVQHLPVLFSHHRTHRKWYLYSHWGHRQNCSWMEVTSPRGASDHLRPHPDFWRHKTCNQLLAYYCTMAHLWGNSLLYTSVSCSLKILPYPSRNTSIFQSSPVVLHLGGGVISPIPMALIKNIYANHSQVCVLFLFLSTSQQKCSFLYIAIRSLPRAQIYYLHPCVLRLLLLSWVSPPDAKLFKVDPSEVSVWLFPFSFLCVLYPIFKNNVSLLLEQARRTQKNHWRLIVKSVIVPCV